jgi:cytochrome c oxidase subunit 2
MRAGARGRGLRRFAVGPGTRRRRRPPHRPPLALHTLRVRPNPLNPRKAATLVIGGGVALPTVLLAILLAYGLNLLADLLAPPPESALRVHVIGEQWWWRVRYPAADDGPPVELANEIRVPVNEPVEFLLEAADVIHSFWIPSLGGKVDMIPGRRTRLVLQPTKVGRYRGICAEYCGGSHALMALDVVVEPADRFHAWLAAQAAPATAATSDSARRGEILFSRYGCAACHSIRGGGAGGAVGPDLTHFGSRLTVGASLLANDPANVARWISQCETLKPEAFMPSFDMIPDDDLRDLAAYLSELE